MPIEVLCSAAGAGYLKDASPASVNYRHPHRLLSVFSKHASSFIAGAESYQLVPYRITRQPEHG